ncbi:unnamed protein product [Moneuplotes crassus]|uniref:Uncharacterized protein n=1 Tax=Euplotes crassus TaxID=5936 RepID=A0AAD1U348_EUPCR|nr:unnamed protein product [Moneuplotes crassus]
MDRLINMMVTKVVKRFSEKDRSHKVREMIENEIKNHFTNESKSGSKFAYLNGSHLTQIEIKIKRKLLAERGHSIEMKSNASQHSTFQNVARHLKSVSPTPQQRGSVFAGSPLKNNEYSTAMPELVQASDNQTQRQMTKSVELIKKVDHKRVKSRGNHSYLKQGGINSIAQRIPRFNNQDNMSFFSGQDEWDEIEKFNALAEERDRKLKAITTQKNQKKMQESLRKQIQEQRSIKALSLN